MLDQVIKGLDIKKGGIYVDGTTGGAGHSRQIAKKLNGTGKLICIDQDDEALTEAKKQLADFNNIIYIKNNFGNIKQILDELKIKKTNGMLLDIGVSSWQIDEASRGFSYTKDGPLDMRMNLDSELKASDIVNDYEQYVIAKILKEYGEEEFGSLIAKNIVIARTNKRIETTAQLREIIEASLPLAVKFKRGNGCKKAFQALRITTNDELGVLQKGIVDGFEALKAGGRLAVITFHSLEDRIVKQTFNDMAQGCECVEYSPVCICGKSPKGKLITKKPIVAEQKEQEQNTRSKSAKLRIIEKL